MSNLETKEISLYSFFSYLFSIKKSIIYLFTIFIAISILIIMNLDRVYRVEVLLAPTDSSGSSNIGGQAAAIANLAGINLSTTSAFSGKTEQSLKILESKEFLIGFISEYDYAPEILAVKAWESSSNTIKYDNSFDSLKREWLGPPPSYLAVVDEFKKNNLNIFRDPLGGEFLTITLEHSSPHLALEILNNLIKSINNTIRNRDLNSANQAVIYLTDQLNQTNIIEVRSVFSNIIESQLQKKLLANINDQYAFTIIDPPMLPIAPYRPNTLILLAVSCLLIFSLIFTILFAAFLRGYVLLFSIKPFNLRFIENAS